MNTYSGGNPDGEGERSSFQQHKNLGSHRAVESPPPPTKRDLDQQWQEWTRQNQGHSLPYEEQMEEYRNDNNGNELEIGQNSNYNYFYDNNNNNEGNGIMNSNGGSSSSHNKGESEGPLEGGKSTEELEDLEEVNLSLEEVAGIIENLRHEQVEHRCEAVKKICYIAQALGPERTREELVPFLYESTDDDDEVLIILAKEIGKLIDYVGGSEYVHVLLSPLENLAPNEESSVRDNATASFKKVVDVMPVEHLVSIYFPLMKRLVSNDWYTSRMTAAYIFASSFSRFPSNLHEELILLFGKLSEDDTIMVRRVVALNLAPLVSQVNDRELVWNHLLPCMYRLAEDAQDPVRLQLIPIAIAFLNQMKNSTTLQLNGAMKEVITIALAVANDRSWRVRWSAASNFDEFCTAISPLLDSIPSSSETGMMGIENTSGEDATENKALLEIQHGGDGMSVGDDNNNNSSKTDTNTGAGAGGNGNGIDNGNIAGILNSNEGLETALCETYQRLLQDQEGEVRHAAAQNLRNVAKSLPKHLLVNRVIPYVKILAKDQVEHVRIALASIICDLSPILGKEDAIEHLLPLLLQLLRDSNSSVRLNIISTLDCMNEVVGIDYLSQALLPAILELAKDAKWRVRLAIIQHIPLLAEQLGRDFFNEQLSQLCMAWLSDDIHSIRIAATKNLESLAVMFGEDWALASIIPQLEVMCKDTNHLKRMTALYTLAALVEPFNEENIAQYLSPLVISLIDDKVPNVRLTVARTLEAVGKKTKVVLGEDLLYRLQTLTEDKDRDVRYYADQAIKNTFNE